MSLTHSPEMGKIAAALVQVQREIAPLERNAENPAFRHGYVTLDAILEALKPGLVAYGVAVSQHPGFDEGGVYLETLLVHIESGEWMRSRAGAPLEKVTAQGVGSVITYLRRYALASIFLMAQEDDDGRAGSQQRRPQQQRGQQTAPRGQQRQSTPRPDAPPAQQRQQAPAAPSGEWTPEVEARRLFQAGFLKLLSDQHLTLQELAAGCGIAVDESRPPQKQVFDGLKEIIERDRITVEQVVQRAVDWYASRTRDPEPSVDDIEKQILAEHGSTVPA